MSVKNSENSRPMHQMVAWLTNAAGTASASSSSLRARVAAGLLAATCSLAIGQNTPPKAEPVAPAPNKIQPPVGPTTNSKALNSGGTPAKPGTPNKAEPVKPGVIRPSTQPAAAPQAAPKPPAAKPEAKPAPKPEAQPAAAPGGPVAAPGAVPANEPAAVEPEGSLLQPEGAGQAPATEVPAPELSDETITLSAFSEPVQLTALVNLLATTLNINVSIIGDLQGTVAFNAAVPVKKSELTMLVDSLLGQSGWTITQDPQTGWYLVMQEGSVPLNFRGDIATTRVFSTPNVRPSAILQAVSAQLGGGGAGIPGQPGGGGGGGKLQAFDELGIIIVTDSTRKLAQIDELITRIIEEYNKAKFIRVDLQHIAASTARERLMQLLGEAPQSSGMDGMNGQPVRMPAQPAAPGMGGTASLENLGDRLTIDPQGNALIFRGLAAEITQIKSLLEIIDVPNTLKPRSFFAGSNAAGIAMFAKASGYGEVTTIGQGGNDASGGQFNAQQLGMQQQGLNRGQLGGLGGGTGSTTIGGPMMVVDEVNGNIIYYGTPTQHEQFEKLIEQLDIQSERIVIQEYRLKNSKAEDVADVVMGLLNNQSLVGSSELLPDGGMGGMSGGFGDSFGSRNRSRRNTPQNRQNNPITNPSNPTGAAGEGLELDAANAFVIADIKNNQILVKAPQARQADFKKLIEKIDLRRPQVYLEVQIVAVTWSDTLRLAFETQLINAQGSGGLLQTNFGLTSAGTSAAITDRRNVATGLSGMTAAIIKSDQLPIVVNALQTKADTRILSSPALLVDDNEEAELMSVEQQPYTTTQVATGSPNTTSFGGYESAGTKLNITPSISEDGYLRLEYETELSSFTGAGTNGSPPPKLQNNIKAASITVPSETTVIVGGLNVDTRRTTRIQVPLLGDIPIIGQLFQDYNRTGQTTTLYVFITPRIMREANFGDLKLLTEGPQKRAKIDDLLPAIKPSTIDINGLPPEAMQPAKREPDTAPEPAATEPASSN
jgi:general secretion pathway protein D